MLIEVAPDAIVEGVVMTVTNRQDLDRLDRFEGEDYQRVEVLPFVQMASAPGADLSTCPASESSRIMGFSALV